MWLDARVLPHESTIETDVCVIGAGPAGLTVLEELSATPLRVCLIDSGGSEFDADAQDLSSLARDGDAFRPPAEMRRRQLGGNAHLWNADGGEFGRRVRYLPLHPSVFRERGGASQSGWPFGREELEPYYRRAGEICGLPDAQFETEHWETDRARRHLLPTDSVETVVSLFGAPEAFVEAARRTRDRPHQIVLTHGTATRLESDSSRSRVDRVYVRSLTGGEHRVEASAVVLAGGGIENARLLLLSTADRSIQLGREGDLVGHYFSDHLRFRIGPYRVANPDFFERSGLYDLHREGNSVLQAGLRLSASVVERERLVEAIAMIVPRFRGESRAAARTLRGTMNSLRRGRLPLHQVRSFASLARWSWPVATTGARLALAQRRLSPSLAVGWSRLPSSGSRFDSFDLEVQVELTPRLENFVRLSDEIDSLGQRRAFIDWTLGEDEQRAIDRLGSVYRRAFIEAGLIEDSSEPLTAELLTPNGTNHHSGTTRMHDSPELGVTDATGRIHSLENVWASGSSLFPTVGSENPTLTIVALAIRLADHVREMLLPRESRGAE